MKNFTRWVSILSAACSLALQAQDSTTPAADALTFNKDIAPIVFQNCTGCHRLGEVAPFALQTYQDVAKRGKQIARVTHSRYMPPWKAEPGYGDFQDALGGTQNLAQSGIQLKKFRGHIELNLGDAKWIEVLARSNARNHGRANLSNRWCGLCDRSHWLSGPFVESVLSKTLIQKTRIWEASLP